MSPDPSIPICELDWVCRHISWIAVNELIWWPWEISGIFYTRGLKDDQNPSALKLEGYRLDRHVSREWQSAKCYDGSMQKCGNGAFWLMLLPYPRSHHFQSCSHALWCWISLLRSHIIIRSSLDTLILPHHPLPSLLYQEREKIGLDGVEKKKRET